MTLRDKINWHYWEFIKHHYPFFWSKHLSRKILGKTTDYSCPKNLNEKIQWLMFFTDTSLWTILADKYAVREHVRDCIGEKYLIPLLGHWTNVTEIDFDKLPRKFVMKPNNGSYDAIICQDKDSADYDNIRLKMDYSLKHKFGYENAEPHYLDIPPCIIAEEMLETTNEGGLIDYKIWCFNGNPFGIFIVANRDRVNHKADFVFYDLNWNKQNDYLTSEFRSDFNCPKPENLDEMLDIASKLSRGLPQARIDLYNINGQIYFGEITLSSNFGMMPYFTSEALAEMGQLVKLPNRSFKEVITSLSKRWLPRI